MILSNGFFIPLVPVTLPFGEIRGISAGRQKSSMQNDFTHTHPHPELGMSLGKLHTILRAHSWPFFSVIYKPHYRYKPGSAHTVLEKYRLSSCTLASAPGSHIPFCVRLPHMHVYPGKDPKLPQLTLTEGHASRSLSNFPKHHRICKKCVLL